MRRRSVCGGAQTIERIRITTTTLTRCSLPAAGAAFVLAASLGSAPVPSAATPLATGFLGLAAIVLLGFAARTYRRNAWVFSELARVSST